MTWANQVRILRQQFEALGAVIGGTLINALKPLVKALNAVMSKIISFAQTVSNALGKIFGWKYEVGGGGGVADDFEDAAGSADDMAGSTGKAADNAKKLKQQLQGFDELNVLTSNDDADAGGGSGGGAGAGGGGGAGDGGWVRGETIFEDYESELDTLYELGDYIGTKLSEAMESIDWDSVYEKARNFGTGLASFLNGLISPRLFGNLGKTIANSLNTVLYGLNFFGRQFDWTNFGVSIATGIKSFFENFDFGLLADTLSVWVKGLAELITSTLDEIKDNDTFKTIGQKIVDFISGIDWFGVTWRLTDMFESFAEAAVELPLDLASGIAQGIADKIFGEGKVNIEIPEWMVNMGKIAMGIVNPFYLLVFAIGEIKDRLSGMGTAWKDFQTILAPIVSFVSDNLMVAWNELAPIFDEFATYYVPRLSATFENLIQNVLTPLASLIKTILSPIVIALSGYLKTLWQNVIVPLASAIMSVLSTALMGVSTLLTTTVNPAVKIVINTFEYLWKKVFIPVASYVTSGFKNSFSNAFTMIKGLIEGLKTSLNGLINFITGVFSGNWSRAWNGVKDIFKGAFNMIISVMEGVLNNIINGINTFFSRFRTALNKAASAVGVDISIGAIPPISIPRFEKGGYPKRADLFYANENGVPELVGTMNGKTAVTSGKEITGISDAIYTTGQTEASLLNTAVGLLRIIAEKEYGITQDAIGRSARNYAMEYQRRTGRPAYDF